MKYQRARGTKDLLPEEAIRYRFVMDRLRRVFESYGFDEAETPALETWSLLTAKCGEEVEKQIFRVEGGELGLRFDLTMGLARVVASNPSIPKPYKRYCISKAWRHEEPQSGRLREFWQADADIVGSPSMEADAEVLAVAVDCLKALGLERVHVRINNRKILEALAHSAGIPSSRFHEACRVVDKMDKVGVEGVRRELEARGFGEAGERFLEAIMVRGRFEEVADEALRAVEGVEVGVEGLEELRRIHELAEDYGYADKLVLDYSLARGLDYYTGPIFEVEVEGVSGKLGSVAGGGRYDGLVELLGGPRTPATGISLGVDRLVEVLRMEGKLPGVRTRTRVFIAAASDDVRRDALRLARALRERGINAEVDLMSRKLDRQLKYADAKGIPYAVIVGRRELEAGVYRLRDMGRREERLVSLEELVRELEGG